MLTHSLTLVDRFASGGTGGRGVRVLFSFFFVFGNMRGCVPFVEDTGEEWSIGARKDV